MIFKPRTTKPGKGNKYYIKKANGGYSPCIKGKPTDPDCNVLANCVGYVVGRFNEESKEGSCKYLGSTNAENFYSYAAKWGLKTGQTPKLGAVMCWAKGKAGVDSDGAGHVAIVEKVISKTHVLTSESGYNSYVFKNKTRKKGLNGKWGSGGSYTFLGFIYHPVEFTEQYNLTRLLKEGCTGSDVKELQKELKSKGYNLGKYGADGKFGDITKLAVEKFQKDNKLKVDGIVGKNTAHKLGWLYKGK